MYAASTMQFNNIPHKTRPMYTSNEMAKLMSNLQNENEMLSNITLTKPTNPKW